MRGARLIYAKHGRGSYFLSLPITSAIIQRLLRVQGGHRRSLRDGQRGRVPLRGGDAGGRRDRRDSFCFHPQVGLVQAHPEQPGGLHQEGKLVRTSLSRDRMGPGVTLGPPRSTSTGCVRRRRPSSGSPTCCSLWRVRWRTSG